MDACSPDRSSIAKDIILYLSEHPDAEDTGEGIAARWLPGQEIKPSPTVLKEVLSDLVTQGLMEIRTNEQGLRLYRSRKRKGNR
jgi:hypothetical protein